MHLTPTEHDRLLTFSAAAFAREALARGLRLSAPEAVAVIADEVCWAARTGAGYAEAADAGRTALRADQVLPPVPGLLAEIRVEPVFAEGTRLIVLRYPLGRPEGDRVLLSPEPLPERSADDRLEIDVVNTSEHVVRISSHYPVAQLNPRILLDRTAARGRRLDLPAGELLRLGPGERRTVTLVPVGAPGAG